MPLANEPVGNLYFMSSWAGELRRSIEKNKARLRIPSDHFELLINRKKYEKPVNMPVVDVTADSLIPPPPPGAPPPPRPTIPPPITFPQTFFNIDALSVPSEKPTFRRGNRKKKQATHTPPDSPLLEKKDHNTPERPFGSGKRNRADEDDP